MKLHLHLKAEYFDQIKSGEKKEEYRLYNSYWKKRLKHENYDSIVLYKGYPKATETDKIITLAWRGWVYREIIHPQFGDKEVGVFAIRVCGYFGVGEGMV